MARTPDPSNGNQTGPGKGAVSMMPIVIVVAELVMSALLYAGLRNGPNYEIEGDLGDEPAPAETTT